jgi:hypothetical protein
MNGSVICAATKYATNISAPHSGQRVAGLGVSAPDPHQRHRGR